MKKYLFGAIAALMLMSCNATAETGEITTKSSQINCYSGGVLIYSGSSIGDISSDGSTDSYVFTEEGSGSRKAVSGDCIVFYD